MNKEEEYAWIVMMNVDNSEWLISFLTTGLHKKNTRRLAWLRLLGLMETWDITE